MTPSPTDTATSPGTSTRSASMPRCGRGYATVCCADIAAGTARTIPSAEISTRSPLWNQPPVKRAAVAAGLFQYLRVTFGPRRSNSPRPSAASGPHNAIRCRRSGDPRSRRHRRAGRSRWSRWRPTATAAVRPGTTPPADPPNRRPARRRSSTPSRPNAAASTTGAVARRSWRAGRRSRFPARARTDRDRRPARARRCRRRPGWVAAGAHTRWRVRAAARAGCGSRVRQAECPDDGFDGGEQILVAQFDALGPTVCAVGVAEQRRLAEARAVVDERPTLRQILVVEDEIDRAVVDDVCELGRTERIVHRHRDRPAQQGAEKGLHPAGPLGQPDGHAVADADTPFLQRARDLRRRRPEFAVSQPWAVDLDDRLAVGVTVGADVEQFGERGVEVAVVQDAVGTSPHRLATGHGLRELDERRHTSTI